MAVRPGVKYGSLALAGAGAAAVVAVWSYREPIARDAIDGYLQERGVAASYDIRAIEVRRQRLENVRLGNPNNPDLTADWAEIDVGPSLTGLTVRAVRAGGVRLNGRLVDGTVSLGALDRLLPRSSGAPFRLPDIDLSLEDARLRFDTPFGQLGGKLDGQGNLQGGFEGKLALVAPRLARDANCGATGVTVYGDLSVVGRRPTFKGPVRLATLACGAISGTSADFSLDGSIGENMADWRGKGAVRLFSSAMPGVKILGTEAQVDFRGDARKTDADLDILLGSLSAADMTASRVRLTGKTTLGARGALFSGQMRAARIFAGGLTKKAAAQLGALPEGTPVTPTARQLAAAISALGKGIGGHGDVEASYVDGMGSLALSDVALASARGANLLLPGKKSVVFDERGLRLAGLARFGGGGLPGGTALLNGQGGTITFQPYVAKRSRLTLAPVRFGLAPKGLSVDTVATIDGPLGNGRVSGLVVPLRVRAGQALFTGCQPVSFRALTLDALRLGQTRFNACLTATSLEVPGLRLRGALGTSPMLLSARRARYGLQDGTFGLTEVSAQVGDASRRSLLSAETISGRSTRAGLSGTFDGAAGQIGSVPLRLSAASGPWRFARGVLNLGGQATVSDTDPDGRFLPLLADNISLRLSGGKVDGTALLREPKSGADIADVAFRHNLSSGVGAADLDVANLTFGDRLQPEAITPKTLGVVANVRGAISGTGRVDWSGDAVTSTGRFRTAGLNFAAAFGPVEGLKGEIAFADLLGFVSAPDQKVEIANVNPGISVTDGTMTYRLLPGYRVQVDGGRWPFAGGYLVLDPTTLDMSTTSSRHLTFRVEGLDAARFIAAMDFENVAATGTFDGVLPIVFDDQGGHIVGGRVVARGGGKLSYVGQVSNENLGMMGRFAFDALKSLKYDRLAIDLNGAIDGDVVTRISFAGVNQAPIDGGRTKLPIKILGATNLPFIFNVTITAKFRQLFDMARSFNDPSILINRMVPRLEPLSQDERKPTNPVQPVESGPKQ
jgi:hypothetical protein